MILLQPEKVEYVMFVIPLPTVTEVRPLQPEKAELPMLVTPLGMVIEVRPLQPEYLQVFYYQLFTY